MDLTLLEPESNLLLGVLNTVGPVANVPSNINSIVALSLVSIFAEDVGRNVLPRIVPGAEARGLVAPRRAVYIVSRIREAGREGTYHGQS